MFVISCIIYLHGSVYKLWIKPQMVYNDIVPIMSIELIEHAICESLLFGQVEASNQWVPFACKRHFSHDIILLKLPINAAINVDVVHAFAEVCLECIRYMRASTLYRNITPPSLDTIAICGVTVDNIICLLWPKLIWGLVCFKCTN